MLSFAIMQTYRMYARIMGAGKTLEIGGCLLEKRWAITSRTRTIIIAAWFFSESVLNVSLGLRGASPRVREAPPLGCVEPPIVTAGRCMCACVGSCVRVWCGVGVVCGEVVGWCVHAHVHRAESGSP